MKTTITTIIFLVFSTTISSCLSFSKQEKYSISEITADNFSQLLKEDVTQSLNERAAIFELFQLPVIFTDGKKIREIENWSIARQQVNDGYSVSFLNNKNDEFYLFKYPNESSEIMTFATVSNLKMDGKGIPDGKEKVDMLLREKGFSYKKSTLKKHSDIIIKEYSDDFLIGEVLLNENDTILAINFRLYSRNKPQTN